MFLGFPMNLQLLIRQKPFGHDDSAHVLWFAFGELNTESGWSKAIGRARDARYSNPTSISYSGSSGIFAKSSASFKLSFFRTLLGSNIE